MLGDRTWNGEGPSLESSVPVLGMVGDHFWKVGDHIWDGGRPSLGYWSTILGMVGDHSGNGG